MERDQRPFYLWLLLVALNALQTAYYWPRLPEVMAQHFGAEGRPNGFATRQSFFLFMWAFFLGMSALFFGMAWILRRVPFRWLNIPHKPYWSATPERQRTAVGLIAGPMDWFAAAIIAFLLLVAHLVIRANLHGGRLENGAFIVLLAAWSLFVLGWVVSILRRFKPPEGN